MVKLQWTDAAGGRIEFLDLWRSFAVWLMLLYHLDFDLTEMFGVLPRVFIDSPLASGMELVCCCSFILVSGVCARHSRHPVRRGAVVFLCGMLVTGVTVVIGWPVHFGILHLLGCCMMLYGLLKKPLERVNGPVFAAVCGIAFAALWFMKRGIDCPVSWLFPLGFRGPGFLSYDYFPLLPWLFLYLLGLPLGKWMDAHRDAPLLRARFHPALTFCGRHSMAIYLVHQPLLYGLCWLLFGR